MMRVLLVILTGRSAVAFIRDDVTGRYLLAGEQLSPEFWSRMTNEAGGPHAKA